MPRAKTKKERKEWRIVKMKTDAQMAVEGALSTHHGACISAASSWEKNLKGDLSNKKIEELKSIFMGLITAFYPKQKSI
jgi:hypothetical protein